MIACQQTFVVECINIKETTVIENVAFNNIKNGQHQQSSQQFVSASEAVRLWRIFERQTLVRSNFRSTGRFLDFSFANHYCHGCISLWHCNSHQSSA